eukprot:CAMPEP_0119267056 /NCGR_PEP_ID=MMETSP1329-20130426/5338_1 /TAXON_ID=114041 /ORGANISM="Genus nov. species nov., Strain RCC1024" /LENGTH=160 /DNA_ID=CAMNT_0007266965 /DNA_START=44 /DNA_END=523 /DNA_ORIENTATION=+
MASNRSLPLLLLLASGCKSFELPSRRRVLSVGAAAAFAPRAAYAAKGKYSAADATNAFAQLKAARAALDAVDAPLAKGAFEDAAAALGADAIKAFEENATIVVQAPTLSAEDKKAIGTIRRYGVAADVIIMIGGLAEALDNGDARGSKSYLAKAKGSLDE